ncbi:Pre-rRNA-processing protein TSR2-domain-containing protein [Podospora didyma]|uniref:Pre-rRNA-processing protein TSR2-domain-containing protein n=1 Tax=Podospora didyma TaxID=330526 RepID=A0AAE0NH32_9PEZI|nr:Pre-rRNA-processing protein TSR2-domain-containing protein [Podospora didyma]
MASTSSTPSPATCQSNFEQGVAIALNLWPALTLAVQNHWGGPDSADKRDWFAGAIVELFSDLSKLPALPTPAQLQESDSEPEQVDVETVLLQVMLDEFEVNVDDESAFEVAEQVMRVRNECLRGKFDEVEALRRRWGGGDKKKVVFREVESQDDDADTDWDTDDSGSDDDEDVEMSDAPAAPPPKERKASPEVDEDGFTKVSRKK